MPIKPSQTDHRFCLTCSMHLQAEDSVSGLRCGKNYFALAPTDRKPQPLRHYSETQANNTCDSWVEHLPTKLAVPSG
jgi:hypothetical protein